MPLNANMTVRLVQDHIDTTDPDFPSYKNWHQWVTLGELVRANVLGVPNPRMYEANWVKVLCNNPDCPAWALVDVKFAVSRDFPPVVVPR